MSLIVSTGYSRNCYYQITQEQHNVKVFLSTPTYEKETYLDNFNSAIKWIDKQLLAYQRTELYED